MPLSVGKGKIVVSVIISLLPAVVTVSVGVAVLTGDFLDWCFCFLAIGVGAVSRGVSATGSVLLSVATISSGLP